MPSKNPDRQIVDQIGIKFEGEASGKVFAGDTQYQDGYPIGGGWGAAKPATFATDIFELFSKTKSLNHLNLAGQPNRRIFVNQIEQLFTAIETGLSDAATLQAKIEDGVTRKVSPVKLIEYSLDGSLQP